jgi:hypothetical protein
MKGHCSTSQSPQWAVVPKEEVEDHDLTTVSREAVVANYTFLEKQTTTTLSQK